MKVAKIDTLFKKYLKVEEITLEHEDKTFTRERVCRPNAVAALVFDTVKREFILVEQLKV